jgi:hypothetical protein
MYKTDTMKTLRKDLLISIAPALLLVLGVELRAQDCQDYFPMKEGTTLRYAHYDQKDKLSGTSQMTFKEKKEIPGGMSVLFASSFKDEKEEVVYDSELEMECRDGVLYFDADKLLDPATMSAYESMEVEVTGENLETPLNAAPGTRLKDGGVTAVVSSEGMKIVTLSVQITNRTIAGKETLTTPAGTFNCVKYTYDSFSQFGFVKVNGSGVDWLTHEYGTIRSESYDKKGNLAGYFVLESISQ